jgi:hypothetical protein
MSLYLNLALPRTFILHGIKIISIFNKHTVKHVDIYFSTNFVYCKHIMTQFDFLQTRYQIGSVYTCYWWLILYYYCLRNLLMSSKTDPVVKKYKCQISFTTFPSSRRLLTYYFLPFLLLLVNVRKYLFVNGTVSRDWDGLLMVWMDRALFGEEPLIVFITIYCFLVLNLNFTFFRGIAQKLPLSM